jgi:hypothetical protein
MSMAAGIEALDLGGEMHEQIRRVEEALIGPTPDLPRTARSQLSSTVRPSGLTVPIPVMTTRGARSVMVSSTEWQVQTSSRSR